MFDICQPPPGTLNIAQAHAQQWDKFIKKFGSVNDVYEYIFSFIKV